MPKSIQDLVESPLRDALSPGGLAGFDARVLFDHLLAPTTATVIFVAEQPIELELQQALASAVERLTDSCRANGIVLNSPRFEAYESLSARDYRATVPLDLAED